MGKQAKKAGSKFGGLWTKQKLLIIEEYLKCYAYALKNTKVNRIYIDAFAGSGVTELDNDVNHSDSLFDMFPDLQCEKVESETMIEGSALLSLKYDFDEYYFLELDEERLNKLKENIEAKYPDKLTKIHFIKGDSNKTLVEVLEKITPYDRCLMFLDPYALELNWETLEKISRGVGNDVWYLFPLHALTRVLPKDRTKLNKNEKLVSKMLGTEDWEDTLYEESDQTNMFGVVETNRVSFEELKPFLIDRFKSIFKFVSKDTTLLLNSKNSPLFLLCFMMTNDSEKAQNLAQKFVSGIKKGMEKLK